MLFTNYDFENDLDCDLAHLTTPVESGYATISYTHQLCKLETYRATPKVNICIPASAQPIVMPVLHHRWKEELQHHPDKELVSYVITGLTYGFHIGYHQYQPSILSISNLKHAICDYESRPSPTVLEDRMCGG